MKLRLAAGLLVGGLVACSGCRTTPAIPSATEEAGEQADIVADIGTLCAKLKKRGPPSWQSPDYRSKTVKIITAGADSGDRASQRELVRLMRQHRTADCSIETIDLIETGFNSPLGHDD